MMVTVSEAEFFAYMGPRDVHPRPEADRSVWETRNREVLGISYPGYKNPGDAKVYMLERAP